MQGLNARLNTHMLILEINSAIKLEKNHNIDTCIGFSADLCANKIDWSINSPSPAQLAQWRLCQTKDLVVVVSLIHG